MVILVETLTVFPGLYLFVYIPSITQRDKKGFLGFLKLSGEREYDQSKNIHIFFLIVFNMVTSRLLGTGFFVFVFFKEKTKNICVCVCVCVCVCLCVSQIDRVKIWWWGF